MKQNAITFSLLMLIGFLPIFLSAQVTGQYPLMTINKNNGYQAGVGKLPVVEDDLLGRFQFRGWVTDGEYSPGAEIRSFITGPVNNDGFPAAMQFRTGYPNFQSRMIITADGLVGIGTNTPDFNLHTEGNTHTTGDFFGRIHFDDNGSTDSAPDTYIDEAYFELHQRTAFGVAPNSTTDFGGLLTLAPGASSFDHQLYFADDGIFHRRDDGGAANWTTDWFKLLTSEDINGTENRIAKFTGPSSLGDSQLWDDGTSVGIGTDAPSAAHLLEVNGSTLLNGNTDVSGDLTVSNMGTVGVDLTVNRDHNVGRDLNVQQTATVSNGLAVNTSTIPAGYAVAVGGSVICEEVKVALQADWPDYVFENDYLLPSLKDVNQHINQKGHLPGVPSAATIEQKGLELGDITTIQQEKIEEIFLHLIRMEAELEELKMENQQLKAAMQQTNN
ncbi:MAG: hypothetical protein MI974_21120 [Chitinophagales bacterium]|nr:hypothetical protein [Chitinophagales bacterium]